MRPRPFSTAVAEVVFGWIALVWLGLIPRHPSLLFGPGAAYLHGSPFQLAPVWTTVYWWAVGLTAVNMAWRAVELARGTWSVPKPAYELGFRAAAAIPLGLLLAIPDHALLTLGPGANAAQFTDALAVINKSLFWTFAGIMALTVVRLIATGVRMVMAGSRRREAVML